MISELFFLWLFLHILGAIAAFGFGFYAPIFGMATAKEPQHGNWFMRASKRLSNVIIIPFGLSMLITGGLLVEAGSARWSDLWLTISLVLYFVALGIVFLGQRPTLTKVIELTATPPGPGGQPPEVPALVRRMQLYGVVLLVLTITILALMVWKPSF